MDMRVTVLLENDLERKDLKNAHGLSFFIETEQQKILFDFGPDESFLENARTLGIDLKEVDFAVLSHGHEDHGGGLEAFLRVNRTAPVYVQEEAFLPHFSRQESGDMKPLGIRESFKDHPQVKLLQGNLEISAGMTLYSEIRKREELPPGNETLYMEKNGVVQPDDFHHEQHLLVKERGKSVLFCGCGHQGILNILSTLENQKGETVDAVFGGFHLKKPGKTQPEESYVERLASSLSERSTTYYTCHCTGRKSIAKLQVVLKNQVQAVRTGRRVEI